MAGARVPAVGPDGAPITIPIEKIPELESSDGRVITSAEAAATDKADAERAALGTIGGAVGEYAESALAGVHASQRGMLESVGVPLDRGITGIADFVGGDSARKSTASYLKALDERHPALTATTGLVGNVAGAVGAAAALRLPGGVGVAPIAGARGVAARAAIGGIENVVQATTKDINEAALGDKAVNGEMLVANLPKHFVVGGLLTGAFEGGAHLLSKGMSAATSRAVPALEAGASKAVGRELGLEGEEALVAGTRVRGLNDGAVPTSRRGLADVLIGEQGVQREAAAAEHAGAVDALAGAQTTEAALLSARQEAARKTAAGAGRRGVEAAETEAAEGAFEAAARGGAGVEAAELGGAARRAEAMAAHAAAGEDALAAGERVFAAGEAKEAGVAAAIARADRRVAQVTSEFGAIHESLAAERSAATMSLEAIAKEQQAATRDLQAAVARLGQESGVTPGVPRRFNGKPSGLKMQYAQRPPRVGDLDVETGEIWTKESLAKVAEERAAQTGSQSVVEEIGRLKRLQESLATAQEHSQIHLDAIDGAIAENTVAGRRGVRAATAEAQAEKARVASELTPPIENASKRSGHSMKALDAAEARVKQVEAETAAFIEKARGEGEHAVAKAEKRGAARIASAKADADAARAEVEAVAAKEKGALAKRHDAETKALPEPRTTTDVDPLIRGMSERQASMRGAPIVSGHAAMGAGLSLLHGNPVAAAGALASSFAAGQARNHGNLLAARTLRGLSMTLSEVDEAIRSGATSVLTGTGSKALRSATNEDSDKSPSFEDLSRNLIQLQANPLELERRVREAVGHLALDAPGTYQEILATTQRAHGFLLSILPQPQRDPRSLTPHLEPDDVGPTARYEFMRSSATIDDPLSVFADVEDGSITQTQVDAIAAVYPKLFDKMRVEVKRQTMYLTTPVDYERQIHVGVLLNQVTDEVLEADFQMLMRDSYADKSKKNESANAGSSDASGSKATKNMMSASESIEGGSP